MSVMADIGAAITAEASRRLMSALTQGERDRTIIVLTHDPVVLEHVDRVVSLEAPLRTGERLRAVAT